MVQTITEDRKRQLQETILDKGQNDGTHLLRVALDWGYDEDSVRKYKFDVQRTEHGFSKGMSVLLNVWGQPSSPVRATIIDVQDDGFIVQADDYVDISKKITSKRYEQQYYHINGESSSRRLPMIDYYLEKFRFPYVVISLIFIFMI